MVTHGVNPGLVSHFAKRALLNLTADLGEPTAPPADREGWAALAQRLDIRAIHIAERDTQTSPRHKERGEFVNTWSVEGFVGEGCQPAELGWGSHERHWPAGAHRHTFGCGSAIWLERPGAGTRVRSWTPLEGPYLGFLITHGESISITDYLSVRDGEQVLYRPTVHYAYHPCNDAVLSLHELAGRGWRVQPRWRQLKAEDIDAGMDELGVLLMGHERGAYWYGSRLTNAEAIRLAHNNATSLQTTAGVLSGVIWAMNHPDAGVVDPDEDGLPGGDGGRTSLSRRDGGGLYGLDAAGASGHPVPGGPRLGRPMAIQEHTRELIALDGALRRLPAACSGSQQIHREGQRTMKTRELLTCSTRSSNPRFGG